MNNLTMLPSSILQYLFRFGYFSLLSPLLVGYNVQENNYFKKAGRCHKFAPAFLHAALILSGGVDSWVALQTSGRVLFWTTMGIIMVWIVYMCSTTYTLWCRQEKILLLMNQIGGIYAQLSENGLIVIRKNLVFGLKTLLPLGCFFYGLSIWLFSSVTSPRISAINASYVSCTESASDPGWELFVGTYIFHWTYFLISYFKAMYTVFCYAIPFGVCAIFWITIDALIKGLEQAPPTSENFELVGVVLDAMVRISKAFETCKGTFGFLFAQHGLALIPNLAIMSHRFFQDGFASHVEFVMGATFFLSILILAASVNSQITSIQTWIYQSMSARTKPYPRFTDETLRFRVSLLMNQISEKQFGISGVFFTITYGFVGTVCGLVITYSMVVSQLAQTDEN